MEYVINIFSIILLLVCWFFIIKRVIFDRRAVVKTVEAEVVDKYKSDVVSKYPGASKAENYVVVFKANGKMFAFNVSEFSYNGYRINDRGTLKYKGSRLISFK